MKNLLLLFLFAATLFTSTSCGKDDAPDDNVPGTCTAVVYSERTLASLETFQLAVNAYANDPSTANCEAYRDAAQGYLNALKEFETCTFLVNDAEYQESLREAEAEVADIEC